MLKYYDDLTLLLPSRDAQVPVDIMHEHRSMALTLDKDEQGAFTLFINGIIFNELPDAPVREREPLARSKTSIDMNGRKK